MDYIDASLACPPGAPSALKDISPAPSLPSVRFSERAGREEETMEYAWDVSQDNDGPPSFQSPSLLDRLREYRNNARAAETEIERREWVGEAENLIDALFDPTVTCWCGVVLNAFTGKCDDCLERQARIARKLAEAGEVF